MIRIGPKGCQRGLKATLLSRMPVGVAFDARHVAERVSGWSYAAVFDCLYRLCCDGVIQRSVPGRRGRGGFPSTYIFPKPQTTTTE